MQYGAMDYLIEASDETTRFRLAGERGFAGIECGVARDDLRDQNNTRLNTLLAAKNATGLPITSLCLHHHNNGGIGSMDSEVASTAYVDIHQAIDWAATLGTPVILVPFFFSGAIDQPDAIARAAHAFRSLCAEAEAKGVMLCYEGTLPYAKIHELASLVDSKAFGCYFDLANVVWLGMDTPTEIRGLGSLIRQVHMKDTRVGPGDCRPGRGRVNYPGSVEALRSIGYDRWIVLETPGGTPAQVAEDLAFTQKLFEAEG